MLDFSEQSLKDLEDLLAAFTADGLIENTPDNEFVLRTLSLIFGAYLGEVVLRTFGGAWESGVDGNGDQAALIACGLTMYPVEKVFKRLVVSEVEGIEGYCRASRRILEHLSSA